MKKSTSVILLVLILLLFSLSLYGCKGDPKASELPICGSYGVPGMFCFDLKGGTYTCEVLETDAYGRIMFEYCTYNAITGKDETAIVICQKFDSQYVYFYEDKCYLLYQNDESGRQLLKEKNDWDAPYDETKMSRRANKISFDLTIISDSELEFKQIRTAWCTELGIERAQIRDYCFLDMDNVGNAFYWLAIEKDGTLETYYSIVAKDYSVNMLLHQDGSINTQNISDFKEACGWSYGY